MYEYSAIVNRVVDGDTYDITVSLGFDINVKVRFRLKGVDTPETWRPKTEAEKEHGALATQAVKDLIEGEYVTINTYRKDKYGRYLCDININEIDLAEFLRAKDLLKRDSY